MMRDKILKLLDWIKLYLLGIYSPGRMACDEKYANEVLNHLDSHKGTDRINL